MKDCSFPRKKYVADHIEVLPKSGIRAFFDLVSTMKNVISLGVGEPDFSTPWTMREAAIYSLERGRTSYTSNLGTPELRQAICQYVSNHYQVSYDWQNECLVTIGVSEALDIVMRAIINPGDEVIYTEPCFVSYPAEIAMAHGIPVAVPTYEKDAFALDPKKLRSCITPKSKALLLNFPCNPTGAVLPAKEMEEIARIAIENDLIVITDEIYSELLYEGEHRSIAALPGMRDRTVFLHGFSKAFAMTGWRVGYACGPAEIIDAMMKIHQYSIMCASVMSQEAALEALKNGEKEMENMRESYRERRNLIVDGFNRMGLPCLMPKGAFYVFPNITSTGMTSEEFARKLLEKEKVAVVPGNAFGSSGEGFIRCSYATSIKQIQVALERIGHFLKSEGI
ncbi:MAG: aminotransferase class I/II-fold pyridoxal phosphate-dependent enzyme [Lentisphaeria bacterium]|nr:aminotransferase class I/II-fold pyridoxal phosphate-dependent enzyme [Lentisphaeria bacterium]